MEIETTLTIIKPDAIKNKYTGKILDMIFENDFQIIAMKLIQMIKAEAEEFYAVHRNKPFFEELVEYMSSGPVIVAILQKEDAVKKYRILIGDTNPEKAEEGTIRKKFATSLQENAVHGSDSDENAKIEENFFFSTRERVYS